MNPKPFVVFARSLAGACVGVELAPDANYADLCAAIRDHFLYEPERQLIVWCGKVLDATDTRPLVERGLRHETTVHVVLSLRGGSHN